MNPKKLIKRIWLSFLDFSQNIWFKSKKPVQYLYIEPELTNSIKTEITLFSQPPLITIIITGSSNNLSWLKKNIASIKSQWYGKWEVVIAIDIDIVSDENINNYIRSIVNSKIKGSFIENKTVLNKALAIANGEYILFMDCNDLLTPDALYEVVKAINNESTDFIYSDEDTLQENGRYKDPHFKPDYSPDMLLSHNYLSNLSVINKSLIEKIGGLDTRLESLSSYDLHLKVLEYTHSITHIPKVLYHNWQPSITKYKSNENQKLGCKIINNALIRRGIIAQVQDGLVCGTYRIKYEIKEEPLISIIIPFKDKPALLEMCIKSILNKSTYQNFEIIAVNNNSVEQQTFSIMNKLRDLDKRIQFYDYKSEFNYSAINNFAVDQYANGKHILLLNNDIEIISPEWIEELLMFSQRDDVGAVGAKLYFSNDTIQHAGVIIGIGGFAGHSHKRLPRSSSGYFNRLVIPQNISAVTGACLMVKKKLYHQVGGLDEVNLKIAFNDVDFCLRLQEQGYLNVYTPYCEAYHYESMSRGAEDTPEKKERMSLEGSYLKERHKEYYAKSDSFYNVNLSLDKENFTLKI